MKRKGTQKKGKNTKSLSICDENEENYQTSNAMDAPPASSSSHQTEPAPGSSTDVDVLKVDEPLEHAPVNVIQDPFSSQLQDPSDQHEETESEDEATGSGKKNQRRSYVFTAEQEAQLAEWYAAHPILYNKKLALYRDSQKKANMYKEKSEELGCNGE